MDKLLLKLDGLKLNPIKARSGINAQKSGINYEQRVWDVCSSLCWILNGDEFCTIDEKELGGNSTKPDISCNFMGYNNLSIEIKKFKTPDWMQLSIVPINGIWKSKGRNQIPDSCVSIFESIISENRIYEKIPPFLTGKVKTEEWKTMKNNFKDVYIPCDSQTIAKLYSNKKCKYIQISELGLYHTGNDICNFGVPYFECNQRMRIRTKIHKSNNNGYIQASVTAAIQPVEYPKQSPFSLDDIKKIPTLLKEII